MVLSGYLNPTERKVLHQQSSDVYLLYSEYRIWGGLGLQKNFPINRTITFFARAQAGWGWINVIFLQLQQAIMMVTATQKAD